MQPRRWLGLAAVSALTGALLAGSTPALATPAPMAPVSVSMAKKKSTPALKISSIKNAAGSSKLYVGGKIKVSGTASKSLAKRKVILQRKAGKKWIDAGAKATVSAKGKYAITAKAGTAGKISYRVRTVATTKLRASYSKSMAITVNRKTTPALKISSIIKASGSGVIVSGNAIKISGSASKSLAGKRVSLQRKASGKWISALSSGVVSARGTYSLTATSAGSGTTQYRVSSAGTKTLNAALSNVKTTVLYRWYNLTEQDHVSEWGYVSDDIDTTVTIAGRYYPHSLVSGYNDDGSSIEFNLSYKCASFRTTIGPDDMSDSGKNATFVTLVDGVQKNSTRVSVGKTNYITVNVEQGFRVDLQTFVPPFSGYKSSAPAWGTPQILCSSQPSPTRN